MPKQTIDELVRERNAIITQAMDAAKACHAVQKRLAHAAAAASTTASSATSIWTRMRGTMPRCDASPMM